MFNCQSSRSPSFDTLGLCNTEIWWCGRLGNTRPPQLLAEPGQGRQTAIGHNLHTSGGMGSQTFRYWRSPAVVVKWRDTCSYSTFPRFRPSPPPPPLPEPPQGVDTMHCLDTFLTAWQQLCRTSNVSVKKCILLSAFITPFQPSCTTVEKLYLSNFEW